MSSAASDSIVAGAEQWADALVEWLGITEDEIHVTNSGRDTDLTNRSFKASLSIFSWLHHQVIQDVDDILSSYKRSARQGRPGLSHSMP